MFVIADAVRVRVVGVYCTHMRPPGVPPYRTVVTKGHDRRRGTTELDVQDSADPAGVGQHVARAGGTPAMSIRH